MSFSRADFNYGILLIDGAERRDAKQQRLAGQKILRYRISADLGHTVFGHNEKASRFIACGKAAIKKQAFTPMGIYRQSRTYAEEQADLSISSSIPHFISFVHSNKTYLLR